MCHLPYRMPAGLFQTAPVTPILMCRLTNKPGEVGVVVFASSTDCCCCCCWMSWTPRTAAEERGADSVWRDGEDLTCATSWGVQYFFQWGVICAVMEGGVQQMSSVSTRWVSVIVDTIMCVWQKGVDIPTGSPGGPEAFQTAITSSQCKYV